MNGRLLKDKKTNCFYETVVTLEIILLTKAHAQKLGNPFHSGLEDTTKCVLTWRTPDKMLPSVPASRLLPCGSME